MKLVQYKGYNVIHIQLNFHPDQNYSENERNEKGERNDWLFQTKGG